RAVLVRVARRRSRTRLVWSPAVVAPRHDPVHLVIALRAVLALPQPSGIRVEPEPEGVPDPVGEDAAPGKRGVLRDSPARVHAQDLAGRYPEVLRVGRVVALAHHRVEVAVRAERDVSPVVIRARGGG